MDKYQIQREIGSGNFAKVYLATNLHTNQEVALKLVNKKELKTAKACSRTRAELANIKKLTGHKNVVTLHETFETKKHFGIVMEYLSGGELFEFVRSKEGMAESDAKEMFQEILEGVKHCHDNGVAHRDLKLENILLDKNAKPKIADFGFSKEITDSLMSSSVGSLLYSAPEIIERTAYDGTLCDVWSLGVILYIMLTASMPFDDSNMGDFLVKTSLGSYPDPTGVSHAAQDLISKMLTPDPKSRYTLSDVLSHPWLAEDTQHGQRGCKHSKRRNGVCYKNGDTIRYALVKLNCCDCSCHKGNNNDSTTRDSVISRHCMDCDDFQANDPEVMHRRQVRLSRNSSVSSGYGSEIGSQYLPTPDENSLLGFDLYPILGRRSSVPRKSSASSVSTIKAKNSYQRCSVPARPTILREYASEEDDIVFV